MECEPFLNNINIMLQITLSLEYGRRYNEIIIDFLYLIIPMCLSMC